MKVPELRLPDRERPRGDGVVVAPVEVAESERRCRRFGRWDSSVGEGRGEVLERLAGELERVRGDLMREKKLGVKLEQAVSVVLERWKLGEEAVVEVEVEERWTPDGLGEEGDIVD